MFICNSAQLWNNITVGILASGRRTWDQKTPPRFMFVQRAWALPLWSLQNMELGRHSSSSFHEGPKWMHRFGLYEILIRNMKTSERRSNTACALISISSTLDKSSGGLAWQNVGDFVLTFLLLSVFEVVFIHGFDYISFLNAFYIYQIYEHIGFKDVCLSVRQRVVEMSTKGLDV